MAHNIKPINIKTKISIRVSIPFLAERVRSETRVAGEEHAARSTIRDRHSRSLHRLVRLSGFHYS